MPKQTKLDEQAVIYQPRTKQTEKEKLKDMSFSDKFSYLWEYYKIHAAVAVAVTALLIYMIHEIVTPDVKPALYAAIINSAVDPTALEQYEADFGNSIQINPKRESVELNDTFFISDESSSMTNMQQVLTTYIAAGEIDVIIAPESRFKSYAYFGYISKLSDELPTDVYSSLTDYFMVSDTEEDTTKNAYGIYLTDSDLFKDLTYVSEPYILGIVPNYSHEDVTIDFIRYLFKNMNR